ncbi:MAG: hypothetical protein ABH857_04960 [Elusimicrobiota bacterium]
MNKQNFPKIISFPIILLLIICQPIQTNQINKFAFINKKTVALSSPFYKGSKIAVKLYEEQTAVVIEQYNNGLITKQDILNILPYLDALSIKTNSQMQYNEIKGILNKVLTTQGLQEWQTNRERMSKIREIVSSFDQTNPRLIADKLTDDLLACSFDAVIALLNTMSITDQKKLIRIISMKSKTVCNAQARHYFVSGYFLTKFWDNVDTVFGIDEVNSLHRASKGADIMTELFKEDVETQDMILAEVINVLNSNITYTASGAQRFMPVALAVINMFEGKALQRLPDELSGFRDTMLRNYLLYNRNAESMGGIRYNEDEYEFFDAPCAVSALPAPGHAGRKKFRWLDIGSAPKCADAGKKAGASTLNLLKNVFTGYGTFNEQGITFDFVGTDVIFPSYQYNPGSPKNKFKRVYSTVRGNESKEEVSSVEYWNGLNPKYNVMSDEFAGYTGDEKFDFISMCKVMHHLREWGDTVEMQALAKTIKTGEGEKAINIKARGRAEFYLSDAQRRVVERLLSSLNHGGYLFLDLSLPGQAVRHLDSRNDDVFLIIRRIDDTHFKLFEQVIRYDPDGDCVYPHGEQLLDCPSSRPKGSRYFHKPMREQYFLNDTEYDETKKLMRQADILAYTFQSRDNAAWHHMHKAVEAMNKGDGLREVFSVYLQGVLNIFENEMFSIDEDKKQRARKTIKKILEEAQEIEQKAAKRKKMIEGIQKDARSNNIKALAFDVDGTLLKREETFEYKDGEMPHPFIRNIVSLLKQGIQIVIITGATYDDGTVNQKERVVTPIIDLLGQDGKRYLQNLTIYAKGGGLKVSFDAQGNEIKNDTTRVYTEEEIGKVAEVVRKFKETAFDLSQEEQDLWDRYLKDEILYGKSPVSPWQALSPVSPLSPKGMDEGMVYNFGDPEPETIIWPLVVSKACYNIEIRPLPAPVLSHMPISAEVQFTREERSRLASSSKRVRKAFMNRLTPTLGVTEQQVAWCFHKGIAIYTTDKKTVLETYMREKNIRPREVVYFGDDFHEGENDRPVADIVGLRVVNAGVEVDADIISIEGGPKNTFLIVDNITKALTEERSPEEEKVEYVEDLLKSAGTSMQSIIDYLAPIMKGREEYAGAASYEKGGILEKASIIVKFFKDRLKIREQARIGFLSEPSAPAGLEILNDDLFVKHLLFIMARDSMFFRVWQSICERLRLNYDVYDMKKISPLCQSV